MAKEYKPWEILKMIQEHKLNPGDRIIGHAQQEFEIDFEGVIRYSINNKGNEAPSSYFIPGHNFTIKQKPFTFMEAVNSGKLIKPVNWVGYYPIDTLCKKLASNSPNKIKSLITQLWNIQED